jgi:translation initiation factor IF-1
MSAAGEIRDVCMARDDLVDMEGKVAEVLIGGNFRVEVQGGHTVLAHLAGRMRRNRIRVVLGDQVTVSVSPYDPTRGLITYRAK